MSPAAQRRLAIAGALVVLAVFLGANAHLVTVAYQSQPGCVPVSATSSPARHSC